MISNPEYLLPAYGANLLVLIPVLASLVRANGTASVFGTTTPDSPALRWLVVSLWGAVLAASAGGLIWPAFFAPVVLIQIVYKGTWLIAFVLPTVRRKGSGAVPVGVAVVFLGIVLTYPVAFALATGVGRGG